MKPESWPRYMSEKRLASGEIRYYWSPQIRDLRRGCPVEPEALGADYGAAKERADFLNTHLDAWRTGQEAVKALDNSPKFGTIDWVDRAVQAHRPIQGSERPQPRGLR